jgi:hypothetical protein
VASSPVSTYPRESSSMMNEGTITDSRYRPQVRCRFELCDAGSGLRIGQPLASTGAGSAHLEVCMMN